jgi:hypothetical protein
MIRKGMEFLRRLSTLAHQLDDSLHGYKSHKVNLGNIQNRLNLSKETVTSLEEVEFQVFSQFGDDGIIQYLVSKLDLPNKTFVEFGVESYRESNTRFLLVNNNWKGLVIDGSQKNIDFIRRDYLSTVFQLYSECAFITKDNINDLIARMSFHQDLGLLSIDIDGNDYWIWKAITAVHPIIVISEYNADFGANNPWTIPYQVDFVYGKVHPRNYWGTSLLSLCDLAEEKGYAFVGCNSQGNNAYFIRNDKLGNFRKLTCEAGYNPAKFFIVRDKSGHRVDLQERLKLLAGLTVFNTRTQKIENIV